jgi:thiamine biosynthesis lipoprotein
MAVGLGGIAKGYALDLAAQELRASGYSDFLLDAGGQIYAGGRVGERPWRVGIRDPRGGPEDWIGYLSVEDASTSSSGDYENYFIGADGTRYHHILDPKTGWPARGLRSVCVLHPEAALADAYSTAIFVLGPERGLAFAEREKFDALLIDDHDQIYMTEGMRTRVTFR